ncbi:MAG: UDP-N-acetylglucosamine 1-carboxyvinyltransferase [Caldilineaceae bacterium SB0665_bin_21]|nr:UDP-N-acetylglucosamine 1-carboxyvinyltransferase [Caldilineaceae bacterium SB0665_bin_21]MYA03781.1 UDP-N-acetylglucosamine 1-carboxyvinyltransferase [Caldilineaceae bacterium SB0664_bin_22]MYC62391.1 UDP-N-acetylglucosamine 1-carboxyvinyltransferase [Caldilineaceae bacterium SB0661_bin_34]
MARLLIEGGHPIAGTVRPAGNKNAAMPMICAALLTDQPVVLHNVPRIGDVDNLLLILQGLGVDVAWQGPNTLHLHARTLAFAEPDPALFRQLRGSLTLMGPMLGRTGAFRVAGSAGGDDIGRRRIDTHLQIFSALGVELIGEGDTFALQIDGNLQGADVLLDEASVTATENGVMAAALAQGTTVLHNAACEPHVSDLCRLLVAMGCSINGIGTNRLIIEGQPALGGAEFTVGPDFMEIGTWIGLGAVTCGELRIEGVVAEDLRMMQMIFRERLGMEMALLSGGAGEQDTLVVAAEQALEVAPEFGGGIPRIASAPWPGFPTDVLSIALVVATQSAGTILFHEKMFESRLYFVDRLIAMGARIVFCDPHRVVVSGPSPLYGQRVSTPDIRAGMALILAALCAEGVTEIGNVTEIDRGYSDIGNRLVRLGARLERIPD